MFISITLTNFDPINILISFESYDLVISTTSLIIYPMPLLQTNNKKKRSPRSKRRPRRMLSWMRCSVVWALMQKRQVMRRPRRQRRRLGRHKRRRKGRPTQKIKRRKRSRRQRRRQPSRRRRNRILSKLISPQMLRQQPRRHWRKRCRNNKVEVIKSITGRI